MNQHPKKSKRKREKLATLIDNGESLYLVSSIGDDSQAIYKRIGGGNAKLVTIHKQHSAYACNHYWPKFLTTKKCGLYGKKIDIEQFFLDAL